MTRRLVGLFVVTLIVVSSIQGCGGESYPSAYHKEILAENMLATDYSGLVEIVDQRIRQQAALVENGDSADLMEIVYTARVVETFYGQSGEEIEFSRYQRRDETPAEDGLVSRIVSLCIDQDGRLYLPDVGYEFPVDEVLVDTARAISQDLAVGQTQNQEHGVSVCR